jgi:hypothetical protein
MIIWFILVFWRLSVSTRLLHCLLAWILLASQIYLLNLATADFSHRSVMTRIFQFFLAWPLKARPSPVTRICNFFNQGECDVAAYLQEVFRLGLR